jgi:Lipocalin-like domain
MTFECNLKGSGRGAIAALAMAILLSACATVHARAQGNPGLVGTWILTGADRENPDGTVVADYGPSPHGQVIFTSDGYYSVQIYRAERTKFASGDKSKGTPEEFRDASLGMSVHFGRYSVDPAHHTITFHVDRGSYPNTDDSSPVRPYELKGDVLSWRVQARPDGAIPITTMRRAN